jgi:hypothetical protein
MQRQRSAGRVSTSLDRWDAADAVSLGGTRPRRCIGVRSARAQTERLVHHSRDCRSGSLACLLARLRVAFASTMTMTMLSVASMLAAMFLSAVQGHRGGSHSRGSAMTARMGFENALLHRLVGRGGQQSRGRGFAVHDHDIIPPAV